LFPATSIEKSHIITCIRLQIPSRVLSLFIFQV